MFKILSSNLGITQATRYRVKEALKATTDTIPYSITILTNHRHRIPTPARANNQCLSTNYKGYRTIQCSGIEVRVPQMAKTNQTRSLKVTTMATNDSRAKTSPQILVIRFPDLRLLG
jgi:hypothetical protein